MDIRDLGKKYNLDGKVDVWKCHNNWILTHDAITKIAHIENIKLVNIESIYQSETSCRFLITMTKYDDGGEPMESITSVGEADTKSVKMPYIASMAEKRGIDRCVLKLINAYEYGISSEIEAEDFKKPLHYRKTEEHLARFDELLKDKMFDGKRSRIKDLWKEQDSLSKTNTFLNQMEQRINENNEKELENNENY